MSKDLVARLRARNERFQATCGSFAYYGGGDSVLDCEAADRIEALEAENEKLKNQKRSDE